MGLGKMPGCPLRPITADREHRTRRRTLAPDLRRQPSNVTSSPCSGTGMSDRWLSLLTSGTTMRWPRTLRASFLASRRETCRVMVRGPTSASRCSARGWRRVRRLSKPFATLERKRGVFPAKRLHRSRKAPQVRQRRFGCHSELAGWGPTGRPELAKGYVGWRGNLSAPSTGNATLAPTSRRAPGAGGGPLPCSRPAHSHGPSFLTEISSAFLSTFMPVDTSGDRITCSQRPK